MISARFDRLTYLVAQRMPRRGLVAALGLLGFMIPGPAEAKKKRRRKKKKIKRNAFGCVNVGGFCKNSGQCCSGICQGKKGKKTCQAHDTGGCTGEQDVCDGDVAPCVTATGENGLGCVRTTGNAGYCHISGFCAACSRDTDCQAMCGPQAACTICEVECGPNGTACVGRSDGSCGLPE